ncbi:MAG TPA: tRNA (N(6)-L-threonylcarbamoyladenosine(37)-C(2))-methylthiotransferase MtaB [Candidatus Xenobia bacterium]
MKFAIHTLGCKVNQYDEERMRRELLRAGLEETPFTDTADLYVINTCTVTSVADRKSRQMIRRAMRANPKARVVATGCAVSHKRGLSLDNRVLRIPNREKRRLLEYLRDDLPAHHHVEVPSTQARTRALLRVQDGCNQFCTFCIVPFVRGRSVSVPPETLMNEAFQLVAAGYQEIVLTGVQLGGYGKADGWSLGVLLDRLAGQFPTVRFRLSSIEPGEFTWDIFDAMAEYANICPHLHLALQHASDSVLERMRRGYTRADYDRLVERFLGDHPDGALTADILVGFPGETEDDFQQLVAYLERQPFAQLHVFPYSNRPGTAAVRFDGQVPEPEKRARTDAVLAVAQRKIRAFRKRFVGRTMEVLVEDGQHGMTANYLPVRVAAPANVRVQVSLHALDGDDLLGAVI